MAKRAKFAGSVSANGRFAMDSLQTALALLKEQFGEFDNIKLLLGAGAGMTPESVTAELLAVAQGVKSGEFTAQTNFPETALEQVVISQ